MANPVRIGLVGLGRAGWGMHLEELKGKEDKCVIVAACDIIPERLEKMKERFPEVHTYDKIEDLIHDPDVELVSEVAASDRRDYTAYPLGTVGMITVIFNLNCYAGLLCIIAEDAVAFNDVGKLLVKMLGCVLAYRAVCVGAVKADGADAHGRRRVNVLFCFCDVCVELLICKQYEA